MNLDQIVDYIILIGALCVAITNIYKFFAKPTSKYTEKRKEDEAKHVREILAEELPKALEAHDLEVRGKYLQDRYKYLVEIKKAVLDDIQGTVNEVKTINISQNEIITALVQTSKDVLRQRIMTIYHTYKKEKRLPVHEREALDELYKDYKAEGGNSYIDKYYGRMIKWETYEDDDYED